MHLESNGDDLEKKMAAIQRGLNENSVRIKKLIPFHSHALKGIRSSLSLEHSKLEKELDLLNEQVFASQYKLKNQIL